MDVRLPLPILSRVQALNFKDRPKAGENEVRSERAVTEDRLEKGDTQPPKAEGRVSFRSAFDRQRPVRRRDRLKRDPFDFDLLRPLIDGGDGKPKERPGPSDKRHLMFPGGEGNRRPGWFLVSNLPFSGFRRQPVRLEEALRVDPLDDEKDPRFGLDLREVPILGDTEDEGLVEPFDVLSRTPRDVGGVQLAVLVEPDFPEGGVESLPERFPVPILALGVPPGESNALKDGVERPEHRPELHSRIGLFSFRRFFFRARFVVDVFLDFASAQNQPERSVRTAKRFLERVEVLEGFEVLADAAGHLAGNRLFRIASQEIDAVALDGVKDQPALTAQMEGFVAPPPEDGHRLGGVRGIFDEFGRVVRDGAREMMVAVNQGH